MQIEKDLVEITSGVRHGYTLGSPISLVVNNDDFKSWVNIMGEDPVEEDEKIRRIVTRPRPGHADLAGSVKYLTTDCRETLERASARETAARTALGTVARQFLQQLLGVQVLSHVVSIGTAETFLFRTKVSIPFGRLSFA